MHGNECWCDACEGGPNRTPLEVLLNRYAPPEATRAEILERLTNQHPPQ